MRTTFRRLTAVLVGVLLLVSLAGCQDKMTQENYDKIQVGMNIWEVEHILGGKGDLQSSGSTGGISSAGLMTMESAPPNQYRWERGGKAVVVTAKDGKVVGKNKEGF